MCSSTCAGLEGEHMGDAIRTERVRSVEGEEARTLRLGIHACSEITFIRRSSAEPFRAKFPLPDFGRRIRRVKGRIYPIALLHVEVNLLGEWRRHVAIIFEDADMTEDCDLLLGGDFLEANGLRQIPGTGEIAINPAPRRRSLAVPAPGPDDELYCPACEEG